MPFVAALDLMIGEGPLVNTTVLRGCEYGKICEDSSSELFSDRLLFLLLVLFWLLRLFLLGFLLVLFEVLLLSVGLYLRVPGKHELISDDSVGEIPY